MKNKIIESMLILAYAFLLCMCAVLICSGASAESAVDLANTENHDGWLDFCTLPDGGLVLAGYTEIADESGPDNGRILCLNADRTVRWTLMDPDTFSYGTVRVTGDGNIAAYYFDGVKFYTPDGEPAGHEIHLPYTSGNVYGITALGILGARRPDDAYQAESLEMKDWNGNTLFRISEPESMWVGSAPIEDGVCLVLCGQEAGDPAEAAAKILKVDLQGNTVWETRLPFLSDRRDCTGATSGIKTSDGGYLAVIWDLTTDPETGAEKSSHVPVKLDSAGRVQWMHPTDFAFWHVVEYNRKYIGYRQFQDPETNLPSIRYLWLDSDGNELGTSELRLCEENLPRYADRNNMSISVEKLISMDDGLWQVLCFWDTDEPEEEDPAWIQQDNLLIRVPEI